MNIKLILAALLITGSALAQNATDEERVANLTAAVDKAVAEDRFSGVVLLAKDGKPLLARAWGMADPAKGTANRPDTKFNLGSINKFLTHIASRLIARSSADVLSARVIFCSADSPASATDEASCATNRPSRNQRAARPADPAGPDQEYADRRAEREAGDIAQSEMTLEIPEGSSMRSVGVTSPGGDARKLSDLTEIDRASSKR